MSQEPGAVPPIPPTEEIAARDAYARRTEATVVAHVDGGVVLDRTVFYPRGGGQPGDTGRLIVGDEAFPVEDTVRRSGVVVHLMAAGTALPEVGAPVVAEIDWDRRYRLMRTHTALHVLSQVVWRDFGAKVTGGNMEPGAARMDFELPAISVDFGKEVEARVNEELAADRPVEIRFVPRAEALADPDLIRTKVNLLPAHIDPIRVVNIVGLDKQADGGTHVARTGEVGPIEVVRTESKGKANKRIRIRLVAP